MGDRNRKLPVGWVEVSLGELTSRIVGGGTPSKSNIGFFSGEIPFMTVKDMNIERPTDTKDHITKEALENSSANLIDPDTLIVATRIGLGKIVRALFPTAINQDLKALYFHDELIDKNFIEQWYRNNEKFIQQIGKGTTVKGIRLEVLKSLRIPFPPLNEQKRIVAKIQELQARTRRAREALENIPDLLEQLRQSILAAAFRGDLTKHWREEHPDVEPASELLKRIRAERRKLWEEAELEKLKAKGFTGDKLDTEFSKRRKQYNEPAPVDTTDLTELPDGWCWGSAEELSEWVTDGTHQPPPFTDKGVPFLVISNMVNGLIEWNSVQKWVTPEVYEMFTGAFKPKKGDIIYSTVGSYGVAVEITTGDKFMFQRHIAHIRPISELFSGTYFAFCLNSPICRKQADKYARGVAQKTINLADLRHFAIPIAPFSEQLQLVVILKKTLETVTERQRRTKMLLGEMEHLNRSILSIAFRGNLVPQDPNDEPAWMLLERIREEKARQATMEKKKGRQKGTKMKISKTKGRDIATILQEADRTMTPEELFSLGGFDEGSVDTFYDQLRDSVFAKKVRETRKGNEVLLEAIK